MRDSDQRRKLFEKACKDIMDALEVEVEEMRNFDSPNLRDDYDKIHARLLFLTSTEVGLSHYYRQALAIKHEVEVERDRARNNLEDAKMEVANKPTFRGLTTQYQSRPEIEAKLRSLTYEENYELTQWSQLFTDVQYLLDVVKSYQLDANKQRRDIDTRLKIFSLQL